MCLGKLNEEIHVRDYYEDDEKLGGLSAGPADRPKVKISEQIRRLVSVSKNRGRNLTFEIAGYHTWL